MGHALPYPPLTDPSGEGEGRRSDTFVLGVSQQPLSPFTMIMKASNIRPKAEKKPTFGHSLLSDTGDETVLEIAGLAHLMCLCTARLSHRTTEACFLEVETRVTRGHALGQMFELFVGRAGAG